MKLRLSLHNGYWTIGEPTKAGIRWIISCKSLTDALSAIYSN